MSDVVRKSVLREVCLSTFAQTLRASNVKRKRKALTTAQCITIEQCLLCSFHKMLNNIQKINENAKNTSKIFILCLIKFEDIDHKRGF